MPSIRTGFLFTSLCLVTSISGRAATKIILNGPFSLPIGTAATWTATVDGSPSPVRAHGEVAALARAPVDFQYRWEVIQNGNEIIFRDFNTVPSISWIPADEGSGTLVVIARNPSTLATETATADFLVSWPSTSTGDSAVIPAGNPLTALYRAPCPAGHSVRAQFAPMGSSLTGGMATPWKSCAGGTTTFIIAGMKASTAYSIAYQDSQAPATGGQVTFTTGAIPQAVRLVLPIWTPSGVSTAPEKVFLESYILTNILPVAYDENGNVIWYNYPPASGGINQLIRPLPGGLMILAQQNGVMQEIDLLGNILRETNITRVAEQISASPWSGILTDAVSHIADFNHDGFQLPDGSIATLSVVERLADQG